MLYNNSIQCVCLLKNPVHEQCGIIAVCVLILKECVFSLCAYLILGGTILQQSCGNVLVSVCEYGLCSTMLQCDCGKIMLTELMTSCQLSGVIALCLY